MSKQPDPTKELERLFYNQLARLEAKLRPHGPHALGPRKPTLEEQEYLLMTESEPEDE